MIFACAISSTIIYAFHNLGYLGMWWDETAQFWISQGINHYAEPGTGPGSISDVFHFNSLQNLDPGGFSVIAHYWTKLSREIEWVRALPLAFFIILQICMGAIAWRVSKSLVIAGIAFALPLMYQWILYFGMENRAYSMEMAGIACSLYFLLRALHRNSLSGFLLLGIICSISLTSRYSFIVCLISLSSVLLYCKPGGWGKTFIPYLYRLILFSIPIFLTGLIIFWYMLRHQLWGEMTDSGYLGFAAPVYSRGSVLAGNTEYWKLVQRNIFSLPAIPITLSIVYFLFIQGPLHRALRRRHCLAPGNFLPSLLFVFVLAMQGTSFAISFLGYYPWDILARWNAYLLAVSMIAVIALLAETHTLWQQYESVMPDSAKRTRTTINILGAVAGMLATLVFSHHGMHYYLSEKSPWSDISKQLDQYHEFQKHPGKLFVTRYDIPVVRYLYEFGPMKGYTDYPDLFRFETDSEWREQSTLDASLENIRYTISRAGIPELKNRFPKSEIAPVDPKQGPLLQVTPSSGI